MKRMKSPTRMASISSGEPVATAPNASPPPAPVRAVLLGAQRFDPTLGSTVAMHGVTGRFAMITAGWQEREDEDEELAVHLAAAGGARAVNLNLYARGLELFAKDPELAKAHRERQVLLRHLQEIYRIRLDYASSAELEVNHYPMPERMRDEMRSTSIEAIQRLDEQHLKKCLTVRLEFDERMNLAERPLVKKHREEIKEALVGCDAVAIAGGHVAILMNRLSLFGLDTAIGTRPVFAWSAGAMAITDRVVLFHDDPPQGQVALQVLDSGLGIVPHTVVFPTPERRLHLDASERMAHLARRFAPATCLVLPDRSFVTWRGLDGGNGYGNAEGALRLTDTGANVPFAPLRGVA